MEKKEIIKKLETTRNEMNLAFEMYSKWLRMKAKNLFVETGNMAFGSPITLTDKEEDEEVMIFDIYLDWDDVKVAFITESFPDFHKIGTINDVYEGGVHKCSLFDFNDKFIIDLIRIITEYAKLDEE